MKDNPLLRWLAACFALAGLATMDDFRRPSMPTAEDIAERAWQLADALVDKAKG